MSEETGRKESMSRGKIVGFIVLVVAVILVLIQLALYLTGGEEGSEVSEGASESVAGDEGDAFVDESGEQEHEFEPAPGEFQGFEGMSVGIDGDFAAVDPVQVTDQGVLLPPHDVSRLGWYSASAVPGDAGNIGSSVITGHVNYQGQGTGYAEKFTRLQENQEFTVVIDGEERTFRVTEKPYRLPKGADFPDVVNDADGANRLVLITCGGQFVGGALGYEDNIITVAEPVDAPVPPEQAQA
ncbi:class F sortase [Corynebacterium accolens]|uniref:class F sortase n=1 Tax=Corynebacterium accolens TaxID=38284 RepID=UPI0025430E61|nr:class F sortase [Corynebacterium accolens]MDK4332934.1 class F sortase [Corynebacterium accolens]